MLTYRHILSTIGVVGVLAGCSGSPSSSAPTPAPVISITGVQDGATYEGAVTLGIAVDRGSYTAALNGVTVVNGAQVRDPGAYVLEVSARNAEATASARAAFNVRFAGGRVLLIRLLDLGPNEAGGGGDAILLTDSTGSGMRHALIDAGPAGVDASDPGYVARRLAALGVTSLEFVQLTHAHSDHYGALPPVLNGISTNWFVYNGQQRNNVSGYATVLTAAGARAARVVVPAEVTAMPFGFSEGVAQVVPPLPDFLANASASSEELNEGSLGTSVRLGTFSMFFTGDGEVRANQRWRTQFGSLSGNLTVLKAGHHGANDAIFDNAFSGSSAWLAHTAPRVTVISANGRTHPRVNALNAIMNRPQTETYCTNVHGEITIRVAPSGQYAVSTERNGALDCRPGSGAGT